MRRVRRLAVAAGFLFLGGCGFFHNGPPADDPGLTVPQESVSFAGEKATPDERAACEAIGGEVQRAGMLGWEHCILTYSDAGKACRDGAECEGMCLADDMGQDDGSASGTCQVTSNPFGCYAQMENGKAGPGLCVD